MLAIKIVETDKLIELTPGAFATIVMECPIFDREALERTYSYPFSLPASNANLVALDFINRLDASAAVERAAQLYLGGYMFEEGVLVVKSITNKTINVVFQNTTIDLQKRLRAVGIQDVPMPVQLTDAYCPAVTLSYTYPVPGNPKTHVAIRIDGMVYIGAKTDIPALVLAINTDYPGLATATLLPGAPPVGGFTGITINCIAGIEDIDVRIIFSDEIPVYAEQFIVFSISNDNERVSADVAAVIEAGSFGSSLCFPVVYAPNLYAGKNEGFSGYANYTDINGDCSLLPGGFSSGANLAWATMPLPMPRLRYVANQLAAHFGYTVGGSLWAVDEINEEAIVWTNRPAETVWTQLVVPIRYVGIGRVRIPDTTVQVNTLLPDGDSMDFFTRIANTFCCYITFRRGEIRCQLIRPLLRNNPQDWTIFTDPNYAADIAAPTPYSLDYDRGDEAPVLAGQLERIDGGENAQEFKPGFFTLYDYDTTDDFNTDEENPRSWRLPYTTEEGISAAHSVSQKTSFRLLFYRGKQQDSRETDYNLATHGTSAYNGIAAGSTSLAWEEQGGLLHYWADYINIITKGKVVTFLVNLPINILIGMASWENPVVRIYNASGTVTGVVRSIKFKAGTEGIGLSEVVLQIM